MASFKSAGEWEANADVFFRSYNNNNNNNNNNNVFIYRGLHIKYMQILI